MSEQDDKDKQEAKEKALVKAKANGFAQGGHQNPAFRTTTQRFEEVMEPDLDRILRKVKRAWERGLDSPHEKIAVDTAHKLTGHLYRPAQEVKVEHTGDAGGNTYNVTQIDSLSPEDKALLARAQRALGKEQAEIEDAVVVEEIHEDDE